MRIQNYKKLFVYPWNVIEKNRGVLRMGLLPTLSLSLSVFTHEGLLWRRFCWTNGRIFLFVPPNTEGEDITEITLEGLGFQSQEQFMLQL
ncbi:machado-joseph disease protein, putative [Eimeria maxima]|uniref:Machado-joseph disease protein, putative n=1 Tax=Eimeria maxima TaxID=5804 RepID=U6M9M5_EIMMA|nr:machado-joseph disease protein, putative [Eimeria maxima]CDJ59743.1 machado-joseph disease protein, putative [Eimeria maxima]